MKVMVNQYSIMAIINERNTMNTMFDAYKKIASSLPKCPEYNLIGVFAFYDAVQILRKLTPSLNKVSFPKPIITKEMKVKTLADFRNKEPASKLGPTGLYESTFAEYRDIERSFTSDDMKNLILESGYVPVSFSKLGDSDSLIKTKKKKIKFINMCINNNWPILVPCRTQFYYTSWLIIVGIKSSDESLCHVVFPEDPYDHRHAKIGGLIVANSRENNFHLMAKKDSINGFYYNSALEDSLIAVTPGHINPNVENGIWNWISQSFKWR